jgi:hypothetical protein
MFFLDSIKEHSDVGVEREVFRKRFDFDIPTAEVEDTYPSTAILGHVTVEEATPHQNLTTTATMGTQKGTYRRMDCSGVILMLMV